ncbi:MAG TPA: peptidoglycan DD-metalloendopeptidase family protein [Patescibacteria group bacterium]|nr:peptidoglycan DD-metalloendopeptidase family protein [Patescibacteria group bacterium]
MKRAILLFTILFAVPFPAIAKPDLASLRAKLASQQEDQARIEGQMKRAQRDMEQTKSDLVGVARSVRDNERELRGVEDKIGSLQREEADVSKLLADDYASMGDLVLALARMRRMPPELLVARPGAPLQTAQTATLLGSILPALNKQADGLGDHLKQLRQIRLSLENDRLKARTTKDALSKKYADISTLVGKRTVLYKNLNTDYQQTAAEIEKISKQAHDMQDLMNRLAERDAERRRSEDEDRTAQPHRHYEWSVPRAGRPQLPVAGVILTGYGQRDPIGAISEGMTIRAQPGALVVAPMGGTVKFSGSFKNYGQLVILEHRDGYVSLIAGLETIDASVGQNLDAGEPVGKLPAASSRGDNPALYYELRYQGRPVNPSGKFPDLKAKS